MAKTLEQAYDTLLRKANDFSLTFGSSDLRKQVLALVPMVKQAQKFGSLLISNSIATSARNRILFYFRSYQGEIINGDELLAIAGISEWARRVRELRVQEGWAITSGKVLNEMARSGDLDLDSFGVPKFRPEHYVLLSGVQDREAAHRWHSANQIRKESSSAKDRILKYLQENVGKEVSSEELFYVAKTSEWARRTRELRTEDGWRIYTNQSGRPDLASGFYVLESLEQAYPHDRRIPDAVRVKLLIRDDYCCQRCGWHREMSAPGDPRVRLEPHHVEHHCDGGSNELENLLSLCNVCHDQVHSGAVTRHEVENLLMKAITGLGYKRS